MINPHVSTPCEYINAWSVVPIADMIMAPSVILLHNVPIDEVQGYMISEMQVRWNHQSKVYETTALAVQGDIGAPVNGVLLRKIPVDKYRHLAVRLFLLLYKGNDSFTPFDVSSFGAFKYEAGDGPTDKNLKRVACIYRVYKHISDSPRKAVAEAFGIAPSTATIWINHARERGYMRDDE